MLQPMFTLEREVTDLRIRRAQVRLATERRVQFIDITELVAQRVRASGITDGLVNVQSMHTTASIVLNENEPFLLQDIESRLEAWAPRNGSYRHNDLEARRFQRIAPDERPNGDSHARSLLLGASQALNVGAGAIELGEWQRLFLVELDGPRERTLSILAMGSA